MRLDNVPVSWIAWGPSAGAKVFHIVCNLLEPHIAAAELQKHWSDLWSAVGSHRKCRWQRVKTLFDIWRNILVECSAPLPQVLLLKWLLCCVPIAPIVWLSNKTCLTYLRRSYAGKRQMQVNRLETREKERIKHAQTTTTTKTRAFVCCLSQTFGR